MEQGTLIKLNGNIYEIDGEKLGEGLYAEVFSAKWRLHKKRVAVKLMHPPDSTRTDIYKSVENRRDGFKTEVQILKKLYNVPWVVRMYDSGVVKGRPVIVEELLDPQKDLRNCADRLPLPEGYNLCVQLASALVMAHDCRILYRDFKKVHLFWTWDNRWGHEKLKIIDWNSSQLGCSTDQFGYDFDEFARQIGDIFPAPLKRILQTDVRSARQVLSRLLDFGIIENLPLPHRVAK